MSISVTHASSTAEQATTRSLTFLGTGASCGVPSFYCGCAACEEALRLPRAARDCSGLLIARGTNDSAGARIGRGAGGAGRAAGADAAENTGGLNVLIDTAPELRTQLIREGVNRVDAVLYTHEHFDHLGGLPQLEFFVRLGSGTPLPIYAGAETLAAIRQRFDFMLEVLDLREITAFETVELDGVRYTPLPAAHSAGAFGYLIEASKTPEEDEMPTTTGAPTKAPAPASTRIRMAYFPDTGPLPEATDAHLATLGARDELDVLAIDATFNGRNWMPASHHSIDEALALIERLGAKQGYLTHLAMHYDTPITLAELEEKLVSYNSNQSKQSKVAVAYDGLCMRL